MVSKRFTMRPVRGQTNPFWAVSEPVLGIALLAVIFSAIFNAPPLGNSFVLFYASGLLPLAVFTDLTAKAAPVLKQNRAALRDPAGSMTGIVLTRMVQGLVVQLGAAALVIAVLVALAGDGPVDFVPVVQAYAALSVLAVGVGAMNALLAHRIGRWPRIWAVLMRPLFVLTGVFFVIDDVPDPYRDWLAWNPLAHVVSLMRDGLYSYYVPAFADPVFVVLTGLAALFAGTLGLAVLDRGVPDAAG
ncbi:MAG: ABC transporter permease [Paracoccaceae bacterium]|nr:ABC transporter permease [Paracoccaceae bacterium]MDP7186165.1 ABC transporter permease [Paracoccaceae bacterium]